MREVTEKVYKFDELSEEAQEKVLADFGDINVDHEWWDIDGLLDPSEKEMKEKRIKAEEIESLLFSYKIGEFDLDRGQYLQLENIVVKNDDVFRQFLEIPKYLWNQCSYYFTNDTRKTNTYLELQTDEEPENNVDLYTLDKAVDIMGNKIHEAWVSLRNNYEYLISEEAIKETILLNEYEFYEDGRMF